MVIVGVKAIAKEGVMQVWVENDNIRNVYNVYCCTLYTLWILSYLIQGCVGFSPQRCPGNNVGYGMKKDILEMGSEMVLSRRGRIALDWI